MKTPLKHPIPVLAAIGLIASLILGQPVIAIGCGFVAFASVAFLSMRGVAKSHTQSPLGDLSADGRVMAKPFRELRADLERAVTEGKDNEAIRIVGGEALIEADRIYDQAIALLRKRDELTLTLRARSEVTVRKQRLEAGLSMAGDKAALESAIHAADDELATFQPILDEVARIDSLLRDANQTLSAIKSRLVVAAAKREGLNYAETDLRQTLTDLRSLEVSFGDAEEFLRETHS